MRVLAVAAPFDNASQRRRPASLDGLHQAMLMQRQRVGLPVGGAMLSKDVGQLQSWLRQSLRPGFAFAGPPGIAAQVVEGATGSEHHLWAHLGVTRGGLDAAVAEQDLNDTDIGSVFQQMGAKAVAQGVDGNPFVKTGRSRRFPADLLQRSGVHVAVFAPSGEEPILRRGLLPLSRRVTRAPPASQHFQQAGGKHGISILLAFGLSKPDQLALGIDIAHLQGHDLGDAQAGAIGGHQRGAIANGADMLEELVYFGRAEDYRKFVGNTASRKSVFRPGRLQSDVVEEFSGYHEVVDRLRRIVPLIDHIQLVFAKFFQAEVFGTGLIKSRQAGNVM